MRNPVLCQIAHKSVPNSALPYTIPELKGVNLDRYRGKGREEIRVTAVK